LPFVVKEIVVVGCKLEFKETKSIIPLSVCHAELVSASSKLESEINSD
jgi:hypothetical protein